MFPPIELRPKDAETNRSKFPRKVVPLSEQHSLLASLSGVAHLRVGTVSRIDESEAQPYREMGWGATRRARVCVRTCKTGSGCRANSLWGMTAITVGRAPVSILPLAPARGSVAPTRLRDLPG